MISVNWFIFIAYTIIPVCKKDVNVFNNFKWELCTYIIIDRHVKIAQQCTTSLSDKTEAHLTDKNNGNMILPAYITLGKAINLNTIVILLLKN